MHETEDAAILFKVFSSMSPSRKSLLYIQLLGLAQMATEVPSTPVDDTPDEDFWQNGLRACTLLMSTGADFNNPPGQGKSCDRYSPELNNHFKSCQWSALVLPNHAVYLLLTEAGLPMARLC